MTFLFGFSLWSLILLSFALVISVPVAFASPEGYIEYKNPLFSALTAWIFLVFLTGLLNSFVV
jgi:photosystem II PsbZ protein